MPKVARVGDLINTGHGCDSTATIDQGSTNVFINGKGAVRVGESDTHTVEFIVVTEEGSYVTCVPHTVSIIFASNKVFVNGKGLARLGDKFGEELISTGSSNVFAG